ncbi:hypothetical protein HDU67_003002 [Dinochytrium kinnereticum]|nr:hypothetical protein HDU67_003002 [Dinochytrium kinnereticum]
MFCNFLFWTKVFVALILSCSGLAYFSWKVYDLRRYALANPEAVSGSSNLYNFTATQNAPIAIPTQADGTVVEDCHFGRTGLARLEPPSGKIMLGYHINWAYDTPSRIRTRINGRSPAVVNAFMQLDMTRAQPFDFDMLAWHGAEVRLTKGILELTIEPINDIAAITDAVYDSIAQRIRDVNVNQGVPVLLRFGHEMNGDWVVAYGYRPLAYTAAFRKMTNAVRRYTNLTAMVWAPNVGIQYPFNSGTGDGVAPRPLPGTPEFIALDTDGNGVLAMGDDPYGPFYPGDEYVDWVGLSIYFYPTENYEDREADKLLWNSEIPRGTYFREQMNAENLDQQVNVNFARNETWAEMQRFYRRYAEAKRKPMLLPETGAPFILFDAEQNAIPARSGELAIKSAWWDQLYSDYTVATWPYLKLFVQFEETKFQHNKTQNWAVTNATTPDVLPAYNEFLTRMSRDIIFGTDMNYGCDGSVKFV